MKAHPAFQRLDSVRKPPARDWLSKPAVVDTLRQPSSSSPAATETAIRTRRRSHLFLTPNHHHLSRLLNLSILSYLLRKTQPPLSSSCRSRPVGYPPRPVVIPIFTLPPSATCLHGPCAEDPASHGSSPSFTYYQRASAQISFASPVSWVAVLREDIR